MRLQQFWQKLGRKLIGKPKLSKPEQSQLKFREKYPGYSMGVHSYGLPIVHDWNEGTTLRIGKYCSIAKNVQIFLGGNHRTDWISTYPFPAFFAAAKGIENYGFSKGDVIIGSDVWLGRNCTILSGVTIGHGAVVGAASVVTKNVEAYSIVGGNPAKHLHWRFDEPTRKALLETAWWDWPEEDIWQVMDKFCSDDIANFIDYAHARKMKPSHS